MGLVDFESGELGLFARADMDQVGVVLVGILLDPLKKTCIVTDESSACRQESVSVGDTLVDEVSVTLWRPIASGVIEEGPVIVSMFRVSYLSHCGYEVRSDCSNADSKLKQLVVSQQLRGVYSCLDHLF